MADVELGWLDRITEIHFPSGLYIVVNISSGDVSPGGLTSSIGFDYGTKGSALKFATFHGSAGFVVQESWLVRLDRFTVPFKNAFTVPSFSIRGTDFDDHISIECLVFPKSGFQPDPSSLFYLKQKDGPTVTPDNVDELLTAHMSGNATTPIVFPAASTQAITVFVGRDHIHGVALAGTTWSGP